MSTSEKTPRVVSAAGTLAAVVILALAIANMLGLVSRDTVLITLYIATAVLGLDLLFRVIPQSSHPHRDEDR